MRGATEPRGRRRRLRIRDTRSITSRGRVTRAPAFRGRRAGMRSHTYSKFSPEAADAVDLESLLEKLADFLLQSGFAGGKHSHPYWGDFGEDEADRSLDA